MEEMIRGFLRGLMLVIVGGVLYQTALIMYTEGGSRELAQFLILGTVVLTPIGLILMCLSVFMREKTSEQE